MPRKKSFHRTVTIFIMNLADRSEKQLTNLPLGRAAMWPHWQVIEIARK